MTVRAPKRWLITGVSTGLGRELMVAALARGDSVVGTVRNLAVRAELEALAPGRAFIIPLDVDDAAHTGPAVEEAVTRLGGLDVLVNNAAFGIFGPVELCSEDDFRRVMETNFFGLLRVTKAALAHVRASRGAIVNFSSISGMVGRAGTSTYNASKFAVEGFSEALAEEMHAFGVTVMLVNPDAFKSDFFADRADNLRLDDDGLYAGRPGGTVGAMLDAYTGNEPGDPAKLVSVVMMALDSDNPPLRLLVGPRGFVTVGDKIARLQADMDGWRAVSSDTLFDA